MKRLFKRAFSSYVTHRYHQLHQIQASNALKALEVERGPLSLRARDECNDYAVDVLGAKHFAPWLFVYSAVRGHFVEGWIPDNFFGSAVVPSWKGKYGDLSDLRASADLLLGSSSLPTRGSHINGLFLGPDFQPMPPGKFLDHLFCGNQRIVFKSDGSMQGLGVRVLTRETFTENDLVGLGNGTFQRWVRQHSSLDAFGAGSVATIRLTTVIESDGSISLRAAYVRFGRDGDLWVRGDNTLRVPISLATGQLDEYGMNSSWQFLSEHPDTGQKFSGFKIPGWEETLSLALELQAKIPFVRVVGWDIALDRDSIPVLLEWNGGHNSIRFSEATQGPCFRGLGWENLSPTKLGVLPT